VIAALLVLFVFVAGAAPGLAQDGASPRSLFESGQLDAALGAIGQSRDRGEARPEDLFLAAQILIKQGRHDDARAEFERMKQSGDPVWASIAESALGVLADDNQRALDAANRAVAEAPDRFFAQYQLGLAKARFEDWAGCAEAFGRAAEIDPEFAYAHYYAGLSYSRIRRADKTSEHFERFLKLAPDAPERAAVESLMRTLRGR
jgi:tetratricopeptide (TPR) repeat protein